VVESIDANFFADRLFAPIATGDYNADGIVDLDDYQIWKTNYGSTINLAADGNNDNRVDAADYVVWRNIYDGFLAGNSVGVPEPGVGALLVPCAMGWISGRWRRRTNRRLSPRRCGKWTGPISQNGHLESNNRKLYESACNPCFLVIGCEQRDDPWGRTRPRAGGVDQPGAARGSRWILVAGTLN